MSIQSEIDRLKGNVSESYSAVQEMGGIVPENANSDNLPEAIRSIGGVYSTEETMIGTWIDGKPLYRRAIQHKTPAKLNEWTTVISNLDGWETMLVAGFFSYNASQKAVFFGLVQYILQKGTDVQMYLKDAWENQNIITVFEYTKKADAIIKI